MLGEPIEKSELFSDIAPVTNPSWGFFMGKLRVIQQTGGVRIFPELTPTFKYPNFSGCCRIMCKQSWFLVVKYKK